MNAQLRHLIVTAAILALSSPAFGQGRTPTPDSAAIGGDVGVFLPRDSALTTGPTLEGFYEFYLSSRQSVRMGAGWLNPRFDREHEDSLRQIRIAFDVVHNWEGGSVHPFVGAGSGVYFPAGSRQRQQRRRFRIKARRDAVPAELSSSRAER
jgi:hypothetical protein